MPYVVCLPTRPVSIKDFFMISVVALVTPMTADASSIDFAALDGLMEWHIASGTDGLLILGTTGESPTLSPMERTALIQHTVRQVRGRIPVMVGTGSNDTAVAIAQTQEAQDLGADYALIVTPYYNKPTQEGLHQHYQAIHDAVDLPQILYNVPGRTACDLLPETVIRLSALPRIIGIKEASGHLDRVSFYRQHAPADFQLWTGCDENTDQFMRLGGNGTISVTANIVPARIHQLVSWGVAGKQEEATALQQALMPLHHALFCETNPIPVKWALAHLGKIQLGIRPPLTVLSEDKRVILIEAVQSHHLC